MSRYRLVIFDMDNVLVDYDIPVRLALLAGKTGLSSEEVYRRGWKSGFEDAADAGRYRDGESYLEGFNAALGASLSRDDWVRARGEAMRPIRPCLDLARRLGGETRIAVLTNNGPLVNEEIGRLAPEVAAIFGKDFHTSSEFGTKKPDPEIYRRMCALYRAPAEKSFFIDDKSTNVRGAAEAGLATHHFTGSAGLLAHFSAS